MENNIKHYKSTPVSTILVFIGLALFMIIAVHQRLQHDGSQYRLH